LFGAWLAIPDAFLAEVIAAQGFDYLCVDLQHGLIDFQCMVEMLRAIALRGAVPIVRVTKNDQAEIMRVLDAGARGVVVPLVETAEEAAAAAAACRYPPRGVRSFGPTRARYTQGTSIARLEEVACFVQVETRRAIDNLTDIAATPGIAGIYIGPSDLALSFGRDPAHPVCHDTMQEEIDAVLRACTGHRIAAGIHCVEGGRASDYAERGFEIITVIVDAGHMARTANLELAKARAGRERAQA
jgi:4-hydroxy-2-oxoheptanedioate aldolase